MFYRNKFKYNNYIIHVAPKFTLNSKFIITVLLWIIFIKYYFFMNPVINTVNLNLVELLDIETDDLILDALLNKELSTKLK